jgi:LytS/YehU family sensor histidine kinase
MFISTKLIFNYVILSPTLNNAIINWKIKEFGIHSDYIGQLQNKEGLFPYLILTFMVVSINTIVIIIQGLVLLLEKKTLIESENTQLRIKNIEAANQKLKQQLQPHFLFNSLNILKTLIKKQPDDAEAYLKRLSDFLRASVSFDNANTVKFEEELKLCMDYLEMQKIRFGDAILFEINFPDEVKTGFVPIFSIQLLLENAIKHNAFTIESPLCIRLIYQERWITVSNNIQHKITTESSAGMGLSNLSERYKIISGDEINIQSSDTYFSVSIKVLPDENSNH